MGKKLVAMVFCAAAFAAVGTTGALAGEINGNGEYIAGSDAAPLKGHSECAFSGLNDEYYILGDTSQPRTQHPLPGDLHGGDNPCKGN